LRPFWVPAIGGGVPLISAKVIPAIVALYSAHLAGQSLTQGHGFTALIQGFVALGILSAYLFRQYSAYQTKKMRFAKLLSDSLYFKNLGNNSGVFHSLLDSSEEEELKEALLAYVFLHDERTSLTSSALDKKIENWFQEKLKVEIDFDVADALDKLKRIGIATSAQEEWKVIPSAKALKKLDELWDGLFDY
jgi:Protein of unknown function (DUF3754)